MVVVLGLMGNDVDMLEPLNHSATNIARNDETDGVSVVGLQFLAVGLVGDDDIIGPYLIPI